MKQGKEFLRIIMLVLAAMVTSYILYSMVRSGGSDLATVRAVVYSTSEGMSTEGFVVRQESVIPADYNLVIPTCAEGGKVAMGQEVALCLRSADALGRQQEIHRAEENLRQLEMALGFHTQLTDGVTVDQRVSESVTAFMAQVSQGHLEEAADAAVTLKALILRQEVGDGDTGAIEAQISRLETELTRLRSATAGDTKPVTADHAGYYSAVCDGYEGTLNLSYLQTVTPEDFRALWEADAPPAPEGTAGKLIDSPRWYYATLVPKESLEDVARGQTLTVVLEGDRNREIQMDVERVDLTGETEGMLVLSTQDKLFEVSAQRRLKVDVIFRAYSGLRVPKEAVCYSEESGSAGVYVLVSGKALWKDIQLIYDNGDTYIAVLDQSSTGNLWPDDQILLDTQGLYDGKVVENA